MKDIDQLIFKAKQISAANKGFLVLGIIDCRGGGWNLTCLIQEGSGSGIKTIKSRHDTLDQAMKEAKRVAKEYPNEYQEVTIIIDDIPRGSP